ncbi:interleukin 12Ba precursor isoform X2 [Paramormyrops kingsleyae]
MQFVLLGALLIIMRSTSCLEARGNNYEVLQPNVVVVEVNLADPSPMVQVPLQCQESHEHEEIIWRNDDVPLLQRGNEINITVEEMLGGNYTCHDSMGSFLNYTLVLIRKSSRKILTGSQDTGYIKCSTQNYNGSFQCAWNWRPRRTGEVVFVKAERHSQVSAITCSLSTNQLSISCLDQSYCPYSEELDQIFMNVGVRYLYRLEEYSLTFFINEIVKPDRVRITRIDTRRIQLEYPDTWSIPHSYFPLAFQVMELPRRGDCSCESQQTEKINTIQDRQWNVRKGYVVCARAQDALCNSTWSDWSLYIFRKQRLQCRKRGYGLSAPVCSLQTCFSMAVGWCLAPGPQP